MQFSLTPFPTEPSAADRLGAAVPITDIASAAGQAATAATSGGFDQLLAGIAPQTAAVAPSRSPEPAQTSPAVAPDVVFSVFSASTEPRARVVETPAESPDLQDAPESQAGVGSAPGGMSHGAGAGDDGGSAVEPDSNPATEPVSEDRAPVVPSDSAVIIAAQTSLPIPTQPTQPPQQTKPTKTSGATADVAGAGEGSVKRRAAWQRNPAWQPPGHAVRAEASPVFSAEGKPVQEGPASKTPTHTVRNDTDISNSTVPPETLSSPDLAPSARVERGLQKRVVPTGQAGAFAEKPTSTGTEAAATVDRVVAAIPTPEQKIGIARASRVAEQKGTPSQTQPGAAVGTRTQDLAATATEAGLAASSGAPDDSALKPVQPGVTTTPSRAVADAAPVSVKVPASKDSNDGITLNVASQQSRGTDHRSSTLSPAASIPSYSGTASPSSPVASGPALAPSPSTSVPQVFVTARGGSTVLSAPADARFVSAAASPAQEWVAAPTVSSAAPETSVSLPHEGLPPSANMVRGVSLLGSTVEADVVQTPEGAAPAATQSPKTQSIGEAPASKRRVAVPSQSADRATSTVPAFSEPPVRVLTQTVAQTGGAEAPAVPRRSADESTAAPVPLLNTQRATAETSQSVRVAPAAVENDNNAQAVRASSRSNTVSHSTAAQDAEKSAALAPVLNKRVEPAASGLRNASVNVGGEQVKTKTFGFGITGAKESGTMPSGSTSALFNAPDHVAASSVAPTSGVAEPQGFPQEFSLPSTAHRAVESVLTMTERFASREQQSVNLQFSVGGSDLNVRVEMRSGEVHTTFQTDSAELCAALSNEWQNVVSQQQADRPVRLAAPVFTSNDHQEMSSSGDGASRQREQEYRGSSQEFVAPRSAVPVSTGTAHSTAAAATAVRAPSTKSRHLHTLA